MNKKRLQILRDCLKTEVKPKLFNMSQWAIEIEKGRPACGTSACALGWATAIPAFAKAGLRLTQTRDSDKYVTIRGMRHRDRGYDENPTYRRSIRTAERFFDITTKQAEYLFAEDVYGRGKPALYRAIRRLDNVIAGKV